MIGIVSVLCVGAVDYLEWPVVGDWARTSEERETGRGREGKPKTLDMENDSNLWEMSTEFLYVRKEPCSTYGAEERTPRLSLFSYVNEEGAPW